jgi:hypothetical protein
VKGEGEKRRRKSRRNGEEGSGPFYMTIAGSRMDDDRLL